MWLGEVGANAANRGEGDRGITEMRGRGLGERGCEDRPENGLPLRPSGGWRDGRLGCVSERFRSNKFSTGLRPSYLQPNVYAYLSNMPAPPQRAAAKDRARRVRRYPPQRRRRC